jgi:hypothetical protein
VHRQPRWSPGQRILNNAGAREPEHRLDPPVPIVACIVWEQDIEEHSYKPASSQVKLSRSGRLAVTRG